MHRISKSGTRRLFKVLAASILVPASFSSAYADIAVCSNDNHSVLINGVVSPAQNPQPDTLSIIELSKSAPKIAATIELPGSVMGPPMAVAVSKDEKYAIVTSASKIDMQSAKLTPDDRVSLVDLKSSPPKMLQQVSSGVGAAGAAISPDGTLVLVANRGEGTVSVFALKNEKLELVTKLDLGNAKSNPSGIAFLPDGKTALLTRDNDHMVSVLHVDGTKVSIDSRAITTGVKPYTIDVSSDGQLAAVSNMGRGDGDIDTVSLIDLSVVPYRTIETLSIASCPEGLKFSPDGKYLAVGAQNGTNKAPNSPFFNNHGRLFLFSVKDKHLQKVAEAPIGQWSQGIAFSRDGQLLMVQNMVEKNIAVFRCKNGKLVPSDPLLVNAGPNSLRTAW